MIDHSPLLQRPPGIPEGQKPVAVQALIPSLAGEALDPYPTTVHSLSAPELARRDTEGPRDTNYA